MAQILKRAAKVAEAQSHSKKIFFDGLYDVIVEFGDSNRVYKNVKAHSIDDGLLTIEYHTQAVYIPLDGVVSITAKPHKVIEDPTGIHCYHHREGEFYIPDIEESC